MKRPSPQFNQAMKDYERLAKAHGANSKQASMQLAIAMSYAPDDVQKLIQDKAKAMGLMPSPSGFDDDGQPVYDVETLSKHFGISEQEIMADFEQGEKIGVSFRHRGNVILIQ